MKKILFTVVLSLILATGAVAIPGPAVKANGLESILSGRILIAVQENGEAWYVNPINLQRYYLGRPSDALSIMRHLGLGISNKDFNSFNGVAPTRLSGRILIKVEDIGRAYYVNPLDLKLYSMGSPANAFEIMSKFGLGITNANLNDITVYASGSEPLITKNKNIQITNNSFTPANLVVKTGAMITWTNNSASKHTITSSGNFDSDKINPEKAYSRMFNIAGTYNYYCSFHPGITGIITVVSE